MVDNSLITDPFDLSCFTYQTVENEVIRKSLLATIDMNIGDGAKTVVISGRNGMGKTVLLSQFLQRNKKCSIGLFIDANNKYSYSEDNLIRDLYLQVNFSLNGSEPKNLESVSKKSLGAKLQMLQYKLKKNSDYLYFIIDGISEIPQESSYIVKEIIELLPFSYENFIFLISLENDSVKRLLPKNKIKEIQVTVFSDDEASKIFGNLNNDEVSDILSVFTGIPERLMSIKRLLSSGLTVEDISQNFSTENESLFEAEWEISSEKITKYKDVVSIIAFSRSPLSPENLADITGMEISKILNCVREIPFLRNINDEVNFKSNGIKLFAHKKLTDLKVTSVQKILEYLKGNQSSASAKSSITDYYETLENYPAIVEHLNSNYLSSIAKEMNGLSELTRHLRIGLNASSKTRSEQSIFRFSFMSSLITGITISNLLKSELKCYLYEGDFGAALELTASAKKSDEKLQLLSIIASHQKNNTGVIDDIVESQVNDLYIKIMPDFLGIEKTIDIALDLFSAFPSLSMKLINKVDHLDSNGSNNSDYAFFRFSIEAIKKNEDGIDSLLNGVETFSTKKRDALSMLSLFKKGTTAEIILRNLNNTDPGESIFILTNWIKSFPSSKENHSLVEFTLSLIVSTTDYFANASVYADIMISLKFMDKDKGNSILKKVQPQLNILKKSGPTQDYVKLEVQILLFERKHNISSNRLDEIMSFIIDGIDDRAIALASMCFLSKTDKVENGIGLMPNFIEIKNNLFLEIIASTAEHDTILKDSILLETEVDVRNAVNWALSLNTRSRRDKATSSIINKSCELGDFESIGKVCIFIRKIKNKNLKFNSLKSLLTAVNKADSISKADFNRLVKARNKIKNNAQLCELNSLLIQITAKIRGGGESQELNVSDALFISWENVDSDWKKIDIAFKLHNDFYKIIPKTARFYKEKAIDLRSTSNIESARVAQTFSNSIDLALRAYYFLCKREVQIESDKSKLINLIDRIPSSTVRLKQLSRLGSILNLTDKSADLKEIVENHIIPILDNLGTNYTIGFYWSAPILFSYSRDLFEHYIKPIAVDSILYDRILSWVERYILNKCILGDPYNSVKNKTVKLSYSEILSYLYIVREFREDSSICFSINKLIDVVILGKKNSRLTQAQFTSIESELESIINEKFDDDEDIKHDGYKICAKGFLLKLKGSKNSVEWDSLVEEARKVPVISDEVFVLGSLVNSIPNSLLDKKSQLLKTAVTLVEKIPVGIDKLGRYSYLVEVGQNFDKQFVKKFVSKAVVLSAAEETEAYHEKRLRLIDSVYSMDRDFANGLSVLLDDDPARKKMIEENISKKNEEKTNEEEWDVANDEIGKNIYSDKYPDLAWNLVAKLNADNHTPNKQSDFRVYLENINSYDSDDTYPLFSYYIHALGISLLNKDAASKRMRPLFDTIIENVHLFADMYEVSLEGARNRRMESTKQFVVSQSSRNDAVKFIKNWVVDNGENDLNIVDPYFSIDNLEFIAETINRDPNFKLKILTSYSQIKKIDLGGASDIAEAINDYWNTNISTEPMPSIEIIFLGLRSLNLDMPIHDRWWITKNGGLRLGSSMASFGKKPIFEISKLPPEEVIGIEQQVGGFFSGSQNLYEGERVRCLRIIVD